MRYTGIKKKCWDEIRRICKKRDTDCYTCGAKALYGSNAQAGHFYPVALNGSNNNRSWDIRFIKLQCGYCNGAGQGMQASFRERLNKELGKKIVDDYFYKSKGKVVDKVKNWDELLATLKAL